MVNRNHPVKNLGKPKRKTIIRTELKVEKTQADFVFSEDGNVLVTIDDKHYRFTLLFLQHAMENAFFHINCKIPVTVIDSK